MVKLRVFLSDETAERIRDMAEIWETSASLVMRAVLQDFLAHPDRAVTILAPHLGSLIDERTPEQREASERTLAALAEIDMEAVARELGG